MDVLLDYAKLLGNLFDYYPNAPEEVRPGIKAILMEPVAGEAVTKAGPLLYAHYDLLDDAGKTLCGQFFAYAREMHWTAYNEQNRSADVVLAVRRDLGETGDFPKPEDDPEPNTTLRDGFNWRRPPEPEKEGGAEMISTGDVAALPAAVLESDAAAPVPPAPPSEK